ncbi:MAG TPA: hypothetical protein VF065_18370 [Ilumatobacter sp.]
MTVAIEETSPRTTWSALRAIGWRSWAFGAMAASAAALVIAVPTRLVANPWFSRMTPTRPQDYVFLVVSSVLLGATLAVGRHRTVSGARPLAGGVATYLAVGCPVCNKVVVMLLGTGGAMTWFAPLQPVIAAVGVLVLATALRSGVRSLQLTSCPVR